MRGGIIEHLPGPLAGWTAMRDVYPVATADVPRVVEVTVMTAARTEILRRIRAALLDVSPRETPEMVRVPRDYLTTDPAPQAEKVERFIDRVAEYQATIRRVAAADLPAAIAAALDRTRGPHAGRPGRPP